MMRATNQNQLMPGWKMRMAKYRGKMARTFININNWEQLAPMAHFDAKEMADLCQLSIRQLERDFHRQFSRPPQDCLNEQRLKAAEQMLLSGQPVKVVASELGYKQTSHFSRQFKLSHQMTPSQFVAMGKRGLDYMI